MKAYIIENSTPLTPFNRPVSSIRFHNCSVHSRLEEQLKKHKFDVEYVSDTRQLTVEAKSIVVQNDILFSDSFWKVLLNAIPNNSKDTHYQVNTAHYPLVIEAEPEENWQNIPLYYCSSAGKFDERSFEPMQIEPQILYSGNRGLPTNMGELSDLRIYLEGFYAIHIRYWFDLHTASSLYTCEFISEKFAALNRFLPVTLIEKLMKKPWLSERGSVIGKNCNIHPTAILEGCIVGDNVEIGAFTCLRASIVSNNATISDRSSLKMAYIGEHTYVAGSDIANSYVGAYSSIIAPMLFNVVFGERSFISGGSGFADFNIGSGQIATRINDEDVASGLKFLGSCVGEDCFIGANMIFAPGRVIPNGSNFLDNSLIKDVPAEADGTYVLSGNQFLQIPNSFIGAKKS